MKFLYYKLTNSKVYIELQNNYFLLGVGLVLFILTYHDLLYLIPTIVYLIYLFNKFKIGLYSLLIVVVIYFSYFLFLEYKEVKTSSSVEGQVVEINKSEKYNKIIIQNKNSKILVYDSGYTKLSIGDLIEVRGNIVNIESNRVWNGFNYKNYLKHNRIDYVLSSQEITKIGHNFHINNIKTKVFSYFERSYDNQTLVFLKALVLGEDDGFSSELVDSLKINGTFHLFAISGSHISLFVTIILSVLKKLKLNNDKSQIIILVFLFFYLVITSFSPSILRASLVYFLIYINKKFQLNFSNIDCATIIFIILLLINPYYAYNLGFSLSFIVSVVILLVSDLLPDNKIVQTLLISLLAIIASFPLTVNINYEINLLSPISNVIYIFIVETVILPISLIIVIFPFLDFLYEYIVNGFSWLSIVFSKYFVINIKFPHMESIDIIIYFLIIGITIKFIYNDKIRKIAFTSFIMFIFLLSNKVLFVNNEIYFLDLYYGESTVIINKGKVIVIDTGDGSNNVTTSFLKSKGIKKVDYLILTHNHEDHNGEVISLINNFFISKIIISAYDDSVISQYKKTVKIEKITKISLTGIEMIIYPPSLNYSNVNDNSLIVLLTMDDNKILFTGDATINVENSYQFGKVDVLKVAHHGSITSTSLSFLHDISPTYAVIMAGRVKQFGFPHEAIIERLEQFNIEVYRTDIHYSVKLKIRKKQCIFEYLNEII